MKVIELKLDLEKTGEGITAISLVKAPAIEQNWIAFSEDQIVFSTDNDQKQYAFQTIDEEQRILAGPAMVPDKLIYRVDDEGEPFFVFFTKETIQELSERFLLQGKQNNMTLEHQATLNDLSVVESWLVEDPKRDKSAVYGFDLPEGSWFVKIKVLNDEVWELVKEDSVAGFSVEGVFTSELIKQSKTMKTKKLDEYLAQIKEIFSDEGKTAAEEFGTVEATGSDGAAVAINFPGDTLEAGAAVTITVEGEEVPLPSGEYTLSDGMVLVVAEDGIAGEIKEAEAAGDDEVAEGLAAEQIEKLVTGIAEIISQFQEQVAADFAKAIADSAEELRLEFNKPSVKVVPSTPGGEKKAEIKQGLNKFVKEQKAEK